MRCDCSALYRESSRPSSLCDELLAWIYKNEVQLPEEGKKVSYSREQPRQQAPHRALLASEAITHDSTESFSLIFKPYTLGTIAIRAL